MLTIASVLKSGGDYRPEHVLRLRDMVARHMPGADWRFACLTDRPAYDLPGVICWSMLHDLPGWWSKIELFGMPGSVLYFDLDTIVLDDITPLADRVRSLGIYEFMMLRRFHRGDRFASGVMGWSGSFSWLLEAFLREKRSGGFRYMPKGFYVFEARNTFYGDQSWIAQHLRDAIPPVRVCVAQDALPGIYSWKRHCQRGIPDDASIICFHGKPRPWEVFPYMDNVLPVV